MRIAALVLLATLIAAAPASAQERLCRGQFAPSPPLTKAERERANLERWAASRATFGFRHDLAYVRKLAQADVWVYARHFPVTRRERRYLWFRDELELGAPADRYLQRRRDVFAGVAKYDGWPRMPYLQVGITRDAARHRAALERLVPHPEQLRVKRVRYSKRDLDRVRNRVFDDERALRDAGFILVSSASSVWTNRAEIELITPRTDAAAYFRKRYGPAVKVRVVAAEQSSPRCAKSYMYAISTDGLQLTLHWSSGGSATPEHIELAEYPDRVEVGAVERVSNGINPAIGFDLHAAVALSAPLDGRTVIDAASGQALRLTGPQQGAPPCPPVARLTELEDAIQRRAEYGMRTDAAYVQQVLRRSGVFTRAEMRWLERLMDIQGADDVFRLRARNPDYAGTVFRARYPAAPRIIYQFRRGAAKQLAELRRRSPYPDAVRVKTVDFTLAELEALEERLNQDAEAGGGFFDGAGEAGFFSRGVHTDTASGAVVVRIVARRTDHAAHFAARYGPRVRTELVGERYECVEPL